MAVNTRVGGSPISLGTCFESIPVHNRRRCPMSRVLSARHTRLREIPSREVKASASGGLKECEFKVGIKWQDT